MMWIIRLITAKIRPRLLATANLCVVVYGVALKHSALVISTFKRILRMEQNLKSKTSFSSAGCAIILEMIAQAGQNPKKLAKI
jgi:hypothetical protein